MASFVVGQEFPYDAWQEVLDQAHGGIKQVVPAPIPSNLEGIELRKAQENRVYRYVMNDGSFIDAKADPETGQSTITVVQYKPSVAAQVEERREATGTTASGASATPTATSQATAARLEGNQVRQVEYQTDPETGKTWKVTTYEDSPPKYEEVKASENPSSPSAAQKPETVSAPSNQKFIMRWNPASGEYDEVPNPNYVEPDQKEPPSVNAGTGKYILRRDPTTNELIQEDNPNYVPPKPDDNTVNTNSTNRWIVRRDPTSGELVQEENPNYVPPKPERPTVLPSNNKDEYINTMDAEGNIRSQPNPSYDAALAEFDRQKARLATAVELHKMDAAEAKDELDRWFKMNVDLPFKQSAEARQRAAEIRQAQEAQERAAAARAQYEQRRAEAGLQAGQQAVNAELAQMPYMTGPDFAENMAGAVNAIAAADPSKIHFGAGDFSFKKPNLEAIAAKATARALKSISPAAAAFSGGVTEYATPDYGGINLNPGAPPEHTPLDINAIMGAMGGAPSLGGGGGGEAAPVPYAEPTDEDIASYY